MEPVTVKFEENFMEIVGRLMKKYHYATKAEFIREAVREKIGELEKKEKLDRIMALAGSSKRKTTDKQIHEAGERAFAILEKKFKSKANH